MDNIDIFIYFLYCEFVQSSSGQALRFGILSVTISGKEFDVSTEDTQHKYPRADAEALISKMLEEVRSISDPALLNEIRSQFRSKVPFHLRSYFAAALILRTLGISAGSAKFQPEGARRERLPDAKRNGKRQPSADAAKPGLFSRKTASEKPEKDAPRLAKGTYTGEGTTLFFSMGRRQRFTAQNVLRVLSGITGIEESDIGAIRTFDNYSFVNVHPAAADLIIQDADGTSYKGRKLTVNRARARKDEVRTETRADGSDDSSSDAAPGKRDASGNPIE